MFLSEIRFINHYKMVNHKSDGYESDLTWLTCEYEEMEASFKMLSYKMIE